MSSDSSRFLPEPSYSDTLHGLVRVGLTPVPFASELFGFLIRTPYERRIADWMPIVEMRLRHLAERDKELYRRLDSDELFASIVISATQAAVRTHQREKLLLLAAAVGHTAEGIALSADRQMTFIRFLDELTPSHVVLLSFLSEHAATLSEIDSYESLRDALLKQTSHDHSPDEFQLLCNDLANRVLARFSTGISPFAGLGGPIYRAIEQETPGPRLIVTPLGLDFLSFVEDDSSRSAI